MSDFKDFGEFLDSKLAHLKKSKALLWSKMLYFDHVFLFSDSVVPSEMFGEGARIPPGLNTNA